MIIEHQVLEYEKIISYECKAEPYDVPYMLHFMKKNMDALDLNICGPIIIGYHSDKIEFLIPIDKTITSNDHFLYKEVFKLVNAIMQRHYGSYEEIGRSIEKLKQYISAKSLICTTDPYISVKSEDRGVYDIFIGISENIL